MENKLANQEINNCIGSINYTGILFLASIFIIFILEIISMENKLANQEINNDIGSINYTDILSQVLIVIIFIIINLFAY